MANNKKKKSRELILLLLAVIIVIVAYIVLLNFKDKKSSTRSEEETADATKQIVTLDADSIRSIYFKNESGEMTFTKDSEGVWMYSEDEAFPVDQTKVDSMESSLSAITSSRTIEDATDLDEFGLINPAIQITAAINDGTKTTIAIGDEAPIADGYYATVNDDKNVYIVTKAFYNNFKYNRQEMIAVATIPSITAENVTYLKVENKEKPNFEVSYDENNAADFAGYTNWTMKQPYETNVPADVTALTTLFGNFSSLSFLACVDYNAADLSQYGLENPTAIIDLTYFEEYTKTDDSDSTDTTSDAKSDAESTDSSNTTDETSTSNETAEAETTKIYKDLGLVIGTTDADGNYYAKLKDSSAVYTISADSVTNITEIDAYNNVYHYINLINLEALNKIDIDMKGTTYTMTMDKTSQKIDDKETEVTKYNFNGKEADETTFKELFQTLIGPSTEREIPKEYYDNNQNQTPVMTITYHFNADTNKDTVTIKYLPYDESYYVVNTNGVEYFLTDLRNINKIIEAVEGYQG
ncbi:MAG: hypothetical protein K0S41_3739 [Anaerocolumna sp.]|jgi:hypothetical protein|nr:hypothetical protein [Anaerocolumna sp.]